MASDDENERKLQIPYAGETPPQRFALLWSLVGPAGVNNGAMSKYQLGAGDEFMWTGEKQSTSSEDLMPAGSFQAWQDAFDVDQDLEDAYPQNVGGTWCAFCGNAMVPCNCADQLRFGVNCDVRRRARAARACSLLIS
ncbi:MAG: hypothetical protein CBD91_05495 [Phycisphaeraceae bacterium TMED231]|nr:MAG: hypothetical protein CBD91_05495 [Phycisphaeraceae bacterium TMED231]